MFMRAATTATAAAGMAAAGLAFAAGLGTGAALVGGACLARRMMKQRNSWKDDHESVSATDTLAGDIGPIAGANPI
ncbi:hypothetical protein QWZ14_19290 [Paeniroseomonas aquatica]|uniref:Uncharacterized protein n=1 Tax=Paeniroseomonas aquatica TaxID=373043 RepID=A0ABT8A9N0_9PROT|nr:hypothetical protein [Paeniroseomonas aquatica]MDN3566522.1 hypothetical protein [Paeniroseomonas aquatica]